MKDALEQMKQGMERLISLCEEILSSRDAAPEAVGLQCEITSPMSGVDLGAFICSIGRNDYYVASGCYGNGIARAECGHVHGMEQLPGEKSLDGRPSRNCRNWADIRPDAPLAVEYRAAYEKALAANQLPPHPRWDAPEWATEFLGWFDGVTVRRGIDGWWGGGSVCAVREKDIDQWAIGVCEGWWKQLADEALRRKLPQRYELARKNHSIECMQADLERLLRDKWKLEQELKETA